LNQDQAHFYYPHYLWDNEKVFLLTGNRGGRRNDYAPDLFTERALSFIERNKDRPFFLYLPYTLPHWSDYEEGPETQIVPSDAPYTDETWPQVEKNYAAMVTRLDRDVGRVMGLLRKFGLEGNTIVFFTSDNGPSAERPHDPAFFRSAGPLRGVKRDVYEGGIRVPMIVRWSGHAPTGSVSDQVCAFWDFLPTAAEIAGLPLRSQTDGISMLPAILGRQQESHEYLYWDYGHVRRTYKQAVRMADWKGVRVGAGSPVELYDLATDIGETRNIAVQHAPIVARMEEIMRAARTDSEDYPIREMEQEK